MLKVYDSARTFVRHIHNYKDYYIEKDLSTADKTLRFTYLGKSLDIPNESYIETETDIFVVKEVHPGDEGTAYTCQLDLEDFERSIIPLFQAENVPLLETAQAAMADSGWNVSTNITKQRSIRVYNKTPRAILEKIRDAWMCELRYDTKTKTVYFAEEFGEDRGVYFIPGLNLGRPDVTIDSYEYYTRIRPVGADGLTIASVNDGVEYLENYQYSNKVKTLYWEDTNYTDAQALKDDAEKYLGDLSKPKRSYSASVTDLAKCRQGDTYTPFAYDLGDTIHLIYEAYGINEKQRIVKMKVYPEDPERNTVELSNTALTFEELQDRLNKAADAWETISNADGSIKGVYVHGVQFGDVVNIVTEINTQIDQSETVQNAVTVAEGAAQTASNADRAASTATQAANEALTNANSAVQAASRAWTKAGEAATAAENAQISAGQAATAAGNAQTSANQAATAAGNAQTSADTANQSANNALMGLSTLEHVVDTVNWFAQHKKASTDTTVNANKTYYIYNASTGTLSAVEPVGTENPAAEGWYELDEAISNYVASHVATTADGLSVVGLSNGWRVLVSSGAGAYAAGVFLIDPAGNVAQATTANGVDFIREGETIAEYGEAAVIGKAGESRAYIDYHSFQLIYGSETEPYVHFSDLRDANGTAEIAEYFIWYSTESSATYTTRFNVDSVISVTMNGTPISESSSTYTRNGNVFTFYAVMTQLREYVITYKTTDPVRVYTLGTRSSIITGKGAYSFAAGMNNVASGSCSCAIGDNNGTGGYASLAAGRGNTTSEDYSIALGNVSGAHGKCAFACGYYAAARGNYSVALNARTTARGRSQTVIGEYNKLDTSGDDPGERGKYVFIAGNGTSSNRSNAAALDWNGDLELAGNLTCKNVHPVYHYAGTSASDVVTVTHDLNISGTYYPLVQVCSASSALFVYGVRNITANSFQVLIGCIDGYVMQTSNGKSVTLAWTY